jgi:hypothetical protein
MGLFSRKPALPPDTIEILDRYGRWSFDPRNSGIESLAIGHEQLTEPVMRAYGSSMDAAARAVDELSDALAEEVLPVGGWPVYGAYKLVIDFRDEPAHPSDLRLMEAGLEFLRSRGVPWNTHLSPFEKDFWIARHPRGGEEWIPWPDPPGPELAPAEIGDGEVRHMADILRPADGLINRLHFRRGDGATYQAIILYGDQPADQEPFVWYTEGSLHALCLRVGEALGTPPQWISPELAAFIPQPKMDLS